MYLPESARVPAGLAPTCCRLCRSLAAAFGLALLLGVVATGEAHAGLPSNILIVTVDDMSADSLGAYGCKLPDTSPNIDAFARQSLRFRHAHVQVGNCMPGRNLMWSGLFSHVNGVEGFVQNRKPDYPVLCDLAKAAGYFTAIRGKVSHSTPYSPYAWDAVLDTAADGRRRHTKDPKSYGESTRDGIRLARQAGKPFCLMINISDPHKPFYSERKRGERGEPGEDPHRPTRVFKAEETPVPKFLPADDIVRHELALYYSSVRRADDCFGEIMQALDESLKANDTLVLFLSDHGMPLPFAKTQLYHHSTHTPLMVRWPQVIREGRSDEEHMVSAIDLLPTLVDAMGHKHPTPDRLHGRSLMPLLMGKSQDKRDFVILQYNENSGRNRHPMRAIHTRTHLYIYNPWSNEERKFATATTGTMTYRQMVKRAKTEPEIAARLQLFDHRVLEELYDTQNDPDCLNNLIDNPQTAAVLNDLRQQLQKSLAAIDDPVAPLLADVSNVVMRNAFMQAEDERAAAARRARKGKQGNGKKPPARKPQSR